MNKPVKHFDLPKQHLIGEHYVPARARQSDEIERRRSLPRGTVLLEQQRDGLAIARHIVERVDEAPDLQYVSRMLAASAFNTSWYAFAQHAPVMRRRLYLPELASEDSEEHQTRAGLLRQAREDLALSAAAAAALAFAKAGRHETKRQSFELGRQLGNVGLELACIPVAGATYGLSPIQAQLAARERGLESLEHSRSIAGEVGVNVSVAQLADQDSPLSVFIRRTAPDNVFNAFEEAAEEVRNVA